jgi:hypothetical protein
MDPNQLAQNLRRIASKIDNSKSPKRELVARDLKRIISAMNDVYWIKNGRKEHEDDLKLLQKNLEELGADWVPSTSEDADERGESDWTVDLEKEYAKLSKMIKIYDYGNAFRAVVYQWNDQALKDLQTFLEDKDFEEIELSEHASRKGAFGKEFTAEEFAQITDPNIFS